MITNKNNSNKCMINSSSTKECLLRMVKSPSNWAIVILTYIIWSLVGMRYSSNQNFDMVTAQQDYVMLLSLVSIAMGLINHQTKLVKLALIGSITFLLSFVTLAVTKVGIFWLGYPIGYYLLCPLTLLLSLVQIKDICCFACCKYYGALRECNDATDTNKSEELDTPNKKAQIEGNKTKKQNKKK